MVDWNDMGVNATLRPFIHGPNMSKSSAWSGYAHLLRRERDIEFDRRASGPTTTK